MNPTIGVRCKVCGFWERDGIHNPVLEGRRKGQPWGHAYIPGYPDPPPDPEASGTIRLDSPVKGQAPASRWRPHKVRSLRWIARSRAGMAEAQTYETPARTENTVLRAALERIIALEPTDHMTAAEAGEITRVAVEALEAVEPSALLPSNTLCGRLQQIYESLTAPADHEPECTYRVLNEASHRIELLESALRFYAHGSHMMLSDESAWDTVSGEPPNYWCDESGSATIEDGTIAKKFLLGQWQTWAPDEAPDRLPEESSAATPPAPTHREHAGDCSIHAGLGNGCNCGGGLR